MYQKGQSGFAGRQHKYPVRKHGPAGSAHTLKALTKLRREPVAELIKIADASESQDLKISLWKYLLERRDAGIELGLSGETNDLKADLAALEAPVSKTVSAQAS